VLGAPYPEGSFIDLVPLVQPRIGGRLDDVLNEILEHLYGLVGTELGDDLALLVAEYGPSAEAA
jgi:hypothetical protein